MITRPLDLASKMQPAPRSLDGLFFVNAAMLVLFFSLCGSRFILAPGLGVDFRLPAVDGAIANAKPPTHVINVIDSGQILTNGGQQTLPDLAKWLRDEAGRTPGPLLLVKAGEGVRASTLAEITSTARRAGFEIVFAMEEASRGRTDNKRR